MRVLFLLLAASVCAHPLQQQATTTYTTDINGRRVVDGMSSTTTSGNTTTTSELTQSINGRMVPLEKVEERIVSEDASGNRVVERVIRKFNADGSPGQPEKQRIEERKNSDGSVSSTTTTFRGDINGGFQLAERVISEATKSGDTVQASVTVERPTVNGTLDVVERQNVSRTGDTGSGSTTTLRKNVSGQFYEAARVVTEASQDQSGDKVVNKAQYEVGEGGRLELHSQTVSRIRKNPDGSESREVDLFRRVPGRAESSAAPQLEERQIIEQRKSGDQLTETTLVQRPTINDPSRLSAPIKLGERVCTGANCK
jgi:hypothetical protein